MITEEDLQAAIAECQGIRNPNANTAIKLAAFYTIKNELFGRPQYSFSEAPERPVSEVYIDSETDFAQAVNGRRAEEIWPIVDELVSAVKVVNPRLYASFMAKIE